MLEQKWRSYRSFPWNRKSNCRKLAEEGVFVVINYRGNEEQAKQVQQTIKEQGGNAGIYGCDVSDFSACEAFLKM